MPEETDVSMLTIEHILPQSKGEESNDETDVGAIGNLILISETDNGKVADKNFKDKLSYFSSKHHIYIDDGLKAQKTWNDEDVGARGVALARIGYEEIWNL